MAKQKSGNVKLKKKHMTFREAMKELWENKVLYAMMLPAMVWVAIFCYQPMYGILIAFKDFSYSKGILGSPWADYHGFGNFRFLFNYYGIGQIFFNTIFLNVIFIITGTIASVVLALMFVELKGKRFRKITQSVAIFPHFVTWPVVAMFLGTLIGTNGIVTEVIRKLTGNDIKFYSEPSYWPAILAILKIWQGAGYGTIVYIAAITGFDQEMYEAAQVDGASRFKQIIYITLPLLKPTVVLLTIMAVGGIFNGDFGMIYALVGDNSVLYPTTDVINTFAYRALRTLNNPGMSTATSVFQSVVGFVLVVTVNTITKKIEPESALF